MLNGGGEKYFVEAHSWFQCSVFSIQEQIFVLARENTLVMASAMLCWHIANTPCDTGTLLLCHILLSEINVQVLGFLASVCKFWCCLALVLPH